MKKYFRLPTNVDEKIPTPAQCRKTIIENTAIDKDLAKELGERINDHLRYKLVQLRVQKMLHILAGSTAPSKETVVSNVRSRGWTDHARIVDGTLALWKPASVTENRRSTRHTPLQNTTSLSNSRGYKMFFCNFTCNIVNMQMVTEFLTSQHWPFLQICEKIVFDNGACGRGVITTAPISKHEVVCDYHTDVIITQTVMCRRENTQYILDCGDIVFDATLETCECHPGRRTFGRLLNYRPDNHPQCNARMKRMAINGKDYILFIAKRDIDTLEEICFDYKDPKCKAEFCSRPPASVIAEAQIHRQSSNPSTSSSDPSSRSSEAVSVLSEAQIHRQSSNPSTSSSDPTSRSSDPPTSEPVSASERPHCEQAPLPESQVTSFDNSDPPVCDLSDSILSDSPIF